MSPPAPTEPTEEAPREVAIAVVEEAPDEERPDGAAVSTPSTETARGLLRAFLSRLTVRRNRDGSVVLSRHCREGPVPCRDRLATFATLIDEAARRHDLDPYLLGALAIRESGLDPTVLGRRQEAGIIQLHPRGVGQGVRYVHDVAFREACQSRVDACQAEVLEQGASALATMVERCGGLRRGLGAYASGRCGRGGRAAGRVLQERNQLRRIGRAGR